MPASYFNFPMKVIVIEKETGTLKAIQSFCELNKYTDSFYFFNSTAQTETILGSKDFQFALLSMEEDINELANYVKQLKRLGICVVLMSKKKHDAEFALEWNAFDFISKPFSHAQFQLLLKKMKKVLNEISLDVDRNVFFKVKNSCLVGVNLRDIKYVEALANHVVVYYGSSERLVVHLTMKGIENRLPGNAFTRVHNSYIIRIDKISSVDGNCVVIDKKPIPVSRSNWKTLMQKLDTF